LNNKIKKIKIQKYWKYKIYIYETKTTCSIKSTVYTPTLFKSIRKFNFKNEKKKATCLYEEMSLHPNSLRCTRKFKVLKSKHLSQKKKKKKKKKSMQSKKGITAKI